MVDPENCSDLFLPWLSKIFRPPSHLQPQVPKSTLGRRPFSTTRTVEFASVDQFWVIQNLGGGKAWNNKIKPQNQASEMRKGFLALDFHVANPKNPHPDRKVGAEPKDSTLTDLQPWTTGIDYLQTKGVGRSIQGCLSKACLQMMSRYAEIHTVLWWIYPYKPYALANILRRG